MPSSAQWLDRFMEPSAQALTRMLSFPCPLEGPQTSKKSCDALRVVGREDFIAMKAFAGGPQDLLDARQAIAAATAPLNVDLLRELAKGFGRDAQAVMEELIPR